MTDSRKWAPDDAGDHGNHNTSPEVARLLKLLIASMVTLAILIVVGIVGLIVYRNRLFPKGGEAPHRAVAQAGELAPAPVPVPSPPETRSVVRADSLNAAAVASESSATDADEADEVVEVAKSDETADGSANPPPPSTDIAWLTITTEPPGARVVINGHTERALTRSKYVIPPGAQVTVEKDGYAPQVVGLASTMKPGQNFSTIIPLQPLSGRPDSTR